MNDFTPLFTAIGVSLMVSTTVLLVIVRPLRQVLSLVCKSGESTSFWIAFTIVMLYVAPLFFAVMWTPILETTYVLTLRTALIAALFGTFAGLSFVGYKIATARHI